MGRFLVISSQVVHGAVGLSIAVPALQRLGHEVLPLPTVLLSNHPGHTRSARISLPPTDLDAILAALEHNGWLDRIDGVLTGYLPTAAHVETARTAMTTVRRRNPRALLVADPILGDDPKGLYIDRIAAEAIRDRLLPVADLATPNRFELAFLTGREVRNIDEAARALDCLGCGGGLATSIPDPAPDRLANVLSCDGTLATSAVARERTAPHGTGDLMAAYLLAALVEGSAPDKALSKATAGVAQVLAATLSRDALDISTLPLARLDGTCTVERIGVTRRPTR